MKICNLSFGKIVILSENLAEVIVDEGIVLDEIMVDEYHDFLLNSLEAPFGILINKKNSYSYTFGAQKKILQLDEIKFRAVVTKTSAALMATKTLIATSGITQRNIKFFMDRETALIWLKKELSL
ncbi:hypothetical protein [Hwangdonia lutea]|uniref:STAS/SEC14 domain-containing protein n=1 Tax=Hwangdonia lutea TaxID=3075823 RepID=A0AA97HQD6_9FLAO|nr:hypothetical protein [Hwangdonia sp. SCSIO 19198]WOD42598.1 hypothetical protein RNZ46_11425 [Hwangdonia sp. SCSIO 19198]